MSTLFMIFRRTIAVVLCATLSLSANAEIRFSGFASIKASMLFDDPVDLNGDGVISANENAFGGRYDTDVSFKEDSLFAIQGSADLMDGLTATIQLMAEGGDDFDVEARWAYVSYELNDSWTIQGGRIVLPAYYKSEFERVGYAHSYSRLPYSVYAGLNFDTVDGVRVLNNSYFGDWSVSSSFGLASWSGDITLAATGQDFAGSLDNILLGNVEANYNWLTLFGGVFVTDAVFDSLDAVLVNPTVDGALGPAVDAGLLTAADLQQTKNALTFSGDGLYFYYGFDVDYMDWLLTYEYAEYGIKDAGDSINEVWYVSAGRRFNDFTLLYTFGDYQQPVDQSHIDVLHPIAQPLAAGVKASLAAQYFDMQQISLRYNFHPSAAFKLDLFSWDPVESGEEITGFNLGVDLVF